MSTSSIGAVAARLDDVRSTLGASLTTLGQVEEQLEEYAGTLAALGEGSTADDLREATALAVIAREDLLRVFQLGSNADKSLERYRTRLVGAGSGTTATPRTTAKTTPAKDQEVAAAVERARRGDQTPVLPATAKPEDQRRYVQIDVDHERRIGALRYVGPLDDKGTDDEGTGDKGTEVGTWVTKGATRAKDEPPLYVDRATKREFPRDAAVPLDKLREALAEFRATGRRPRCVSWQDG
ncbi:Imm1 family immunity protein [Allokutzneria sp. A3M-2-11 16]|uniref:Imm1 family immunity protein n=1 Tax=Allokutzneria sp. A3M-2-11 16 TaxID=2962043 RepID=UPI0020B863BA|nr:Imm1 family immunity protein [Allokutzneria sp. A3M-2-11 16]MCP3801443.1 Imm1 family immunity protein [Allokutzneria sp. A3M-2-11 16]